MTRLVAHLSDLHLLARSKGARTAGTHLVSLGRSLDIEGRMERVAKAFRAARLAGADHVVVSGDITEMGRAEEFEVAAEVFASSGFHPRDVTVVPGNHDRYAHGDAWAEALRGPLAAYARNAPHERGNVVDLGTLRLLPIDVTRPQSFARSAGFLSKAILEPLARHLDDLSKHPAPVAIVQHHPPYHRGVVMHWLDGLLGYEREAELLAERASVQVLHGHMHEHSDRPLHGREARILGAPAVVDSKGEPRMRLYDVTSGGLVARVVGSPTCVVEPAISVCA